MSEKAATIYRRGRESPRSPYEAERRLRDLVEETEWDLEWLRERCSRGSNHVRIDG